MPQDSDKPSAEGTVHQRQKEAVEIVRDVYAGTLRMRKKGTKYLPRFPKEESKDYDRRRKQAVLFNGLKRTVKGLVGMVFRKDPPVSDELSEEIDGHLENIDLAGRSLDVFARDLFRAALLDGHAHVFVDQPQVDDDEIRTIRDERRAGVRPYWVIVRKQDIISFRSVNIRGRKVLQQIVWREQVVRPDGKYGDETVTRYRVYRREADDESGQPRVAFEVWEDQKPGESSEELRRVEKGTMDIGRIPLVTAYTNRTGFMESDPPLLDLALENVRHYQARSDRAHVLHFASVPIPFFSGVAMDDLSWGANHAISTEAAEADAKILEPSGQGLEEGRQELQDIEKRMAALGLAMLQRDTRQAETAEARRIEKAETDSSLAAAARGLEDALNEALAKHAEWMDQEVGAAVSVNRDFQNQIISPQMVTTLSGLVGKGQLSVETMWDILEQGEVLPEGFDSDVEQNRIEGAAALDALVPGGVPSNGGEGGEA